MSYNSTYNTNRRPAIAAASVNADLSKDAQLASPPGDSVQEMSWSSAANLLAVAAWDDKLRIYDVSQSTAGVGRAVIDFKGPVLSCDWSDSGHRIVGAGADKTAQLLDLGANGAPAQQIGAHDAPIRSVRFFQGPSNASMVATGSWDQTVKYWDLRSPTAAGTLQCDDKIYTMDVKDKMMVIGTADKGFSIVDLANPMTIFRKTTIAQLKYQTRVVKCFNDATGFVAGTIEGRCAVQSVTKAVEDKGNFSFKCHRAIAINNNTDCYSVNAISFHPIHGTFLTGGSDGTICIWDKENKSRIKLFPALGGPVSAASFNHDGSILAYAISYDWSKGFAHNTPDHVNKVMLHPVAEDDVKPKSSTITKR